MRDCVVCVQLYAILVLVESVALMVLCTVSLLYARQHASEEDDAASVEYTSIVALVASAALLYFSLDSILLENIFQVRTRRDTRETGSAATSAVSCPSAPRATLGRRMAAAGHPMAARRCSATVARSSWLLFCTRVFMYMIFY